MYYLAASLIFLSLALLSAGFSGRSVKSAFGVPWYYFVISTDIGGNKPKLTLRYQSVIGDPDAIFRHALLPIYVIGEAKSRKYYGRRSRGITDYEYNQLTLYMGMVKKTRFAISVCGLFRYADTVKPIDLNVKHFLYLLSLQSEAKDFLKRH